MLASRCIRSVLVYVNLSSWPSSSPHLGMCVGILAQELSVFFDKFIAIFVLYIHSIRFLECTVSKSAASDLPVTVAVETVTELEFFFAIWNKKKSCHSSRDGVEFIGARASFMRATYLSMKAA